MLAPVAPIVVVLLLAVVRGGLMQRTIIPIPGNRFKTCNCKNDMFYFKYVILYSN